MSAASPTRGDFCRCRSEARSVPRHPDFGRERRHLAAVTRWSDADDRVRMAIDCDRATDDGRIGAESSFPAVVADDGDARRLRPIVSDPDCATQCWLHSDRLEIVAAHGHARHAFGLARGSDARRGQGECAEAGERPRSIAIGQILGVHRVGRASRIGSDDAIGIPQRERLQQKLAGERENQDVGAKAQRQHNDRDGRERGISAPHPEAEAQILSDLVQPGKPAPIAIGLLDLIDPAEREDRLPACLAGRHPCSKVVVDMHLQMARELIGELTVRAVAAEDAEKPLQPGAHRSHLRSSPGERNRARIAVV